MICCPSVSWVRKQRAWNVNAVLLATSSPQCPSLFNIVACRHRNCIYNQYFLFLILWPNNEGQPPSPSPPLLLLECPAGGLGSPHSVLRSRRVYLIIGSHTPGTPPEDEPVCATPLGTFSCAESQMSALVRRLNLSSVQLLLLCMSSFGGIRHGKWFQWSENVLG